MEPVTFSLALLGSLVLAVRFRNMTDRKKIEKIMEVTNICIKDKDGTVKYCKYVRKDTERDRKDDLLWTEYVYRLPLGMPYVKLEHLNENIGVFKDGLHKNVEIKFDGGMVHFFVYETDLPNKWKYREVL